MRLSIQVREISNKSRTYKYGQIKKLILIQLKRIFKNNRYSMVSIFIFKLKKIILINSIIFTVSKADHKHLQPEKK